KTPRWLEPGSGGTKGREPVASTSRSYGSTTLPPPPMTTRWSRAIFSALTPAWTRTPCSSHSRAEASRGSPGPLSRPGPWEGGAGGMGVVGPWGAGAEGGEWEAPGGGAQHSPDGLPARHAGADDDQRGATNGLDHGRGPSLRRLRLSDSENR